LRNRFISGKAGRYFSEGNIKDYVSIFLMLSYLKSVFSSVAISRELPSFIFLDTQAKMAIVC